MKTVKRTTKQIVLNRVLTHSHPLPSIPTHSHLNQPIISNFFSRVTVKSRWYAWAYIREEKHFHLQSVILTVLSFFQYKVSILAFFTSYKMWNMFKVNNKDTRICKLNNKVKNKDTIDVVLATLLLILNTRHFLLQCSYCWLWSVNGRLGLLFVLLRLCACWKFPLMGELAI